MYAFSKYIIIDSHERKKFLHRRKKSVTQPKVGPTQFNSKLERFVIIRQFREME